MEQNKFYEFDNIKNYFFDKKSLNTCFDTSKQEYCVEVNFKDYVNDTISFEDFIIKSIGNINFVISPFCKTGSNPISLNPNNGKRKFIKPHQVSGLITAPGNIINGYKKTFWENTFDFFFNFISFPFQLITNTWKCFTETLLGNGNVESISQAWQSVSDLKNKQYNIESKFNPLIPNEFLPTENFGAGRPLSINQTGLGFFYTRLGMPDYYYQCYDPLGWVSSTQNNFLNSGNNYGWELPADTESLILGYLSNDYESNDGVLYGSIMIYEEN